MNIYLLHLFNRALVTLCRCPVFKRADSVDCGSLIVSTYGEEKGVSGVLLMLVWFRLDLPIGRICVMLLLRMYRSEGRSGESADLVNEGRLSMVEEARWDVRKEIGL